MVIDMLTHIGKRKGKAYPVESLLEVMDKAGVDKSMICCQLETIDNEYVHECATKHPERTLGFAVLNPWDMDGEEQMEKCFREYGFYGIKTNGYRFGFSADRHSLLDPYFELCRKYKKCMVVHNMSDLPSLPERWGEMARCFPDVPIVMYHIGVPMMAHSAISVAKKHDNVFVSTCGAFVPVMAEALKCIGASKILFSSDAPFGDMLQEIDKICYITKNENERERIFYKNAADFMGLTL